MFLGCLNVVRLPLRVLLVICFWFCLWFWLDTLNYVALYWIQLVEKLKKHLNPFAQEIFWSWSEVVGSGRKWSKMVENGQKWVVTEDSGWTWSEVAWGRTEWSEKIKNGRKWSEMVKNCQKWSEVGSYSRSSCIRVTSMRTVALVSFLFTLSYTVT